MTTQEQRNIIASETGYADAMAAYPPSACCGYCLVHIDRNHSRHLHAICAGILRARGYNNRSKRILLRKYDAEQRRINEEVSADDPTGDVGLNHPTQANQPAAGSAPVAGSVRHDKGEWK